MRNTNVPFPPEQVDKVHEHTLDDCPKWGLELIDDSPRVIQQAEVRENHCGLMSIADLSTGVTSARGSIRLLSPLRSRREDWSGLV